MHGGTHAPVVLVTGASGFVGRHLVERLLRDGQSRVIVLSRRNSDGSGAGARHVTYLAAPLEQLTKRMWQQAGVSHVDVVFHLAAFTPKTRADADNVESIYRDNLLGTRALMESLPEIPRRFVFSSTLDVYSFPPDDLIDEHYTLGPTSLYGASKLFCERLLLNYGATTGAKVVILRYGHLFGPGEDAYRKLVPQVIRQLLRGEQPVISGDGTAERDLLYISDAVEATIRAGFCPIDGTEVVNIARGKSVQVREVVETLIRLTGFKGDICFKPSSAANQSLRFNNDRMRTALGDWGFVGLEEGLANEVAACRALMHSASAPN